MEDTIVSIATAPGEAGIGIVRISGEKAISIADHIFLSAKNENLSKYEKNKLVYGNIHDEELKIDEVMVSYMKEPHSYTREDVVEINCHGGIVSSRKILDIVLKNGARMAENGEFTKRAFLNGRIDLSQAEAVIDLIKAKTDSGFELAIDQLDGYLSRKISEIRDDLLQIIAHVVVNIEYPDEDIEELTYQKLEKDIDLIHEKVKKLLDSADAGKIIKEGLSTVIIGRPNVGKSSLLNAMLRESRAIVTEIPGTTRDIIEEMVNINGIPLKIVDTAGIRETIDIVEKIGVEKSKEFFNKGDLIIYIINYSEELENDDYEILNLIKQKNAIILLNKTDLPKKIDEKEIERLVGDKKIIKTSILNEKGVDELEKAISDMFLSGYVKQSHNVLITNSRHKNILDRADKFMADATNMAKLNEAFDFIEIDLRNAWEVLGEIIGESITEDIVDEVFSRFCLGK